MLMPPTRTLPLSSQPLFLLLSGVAFTTLLFVSRGHTQVFYVLSRCQLLEPAQQLYKVGDDDDGGDDEDDCHLTNEEAEAPRVRGLCLFRDRAGSSLVLNTAPMLVPLTVTLPAVVLHEDHSHINSYFLVRAKGPSQRSLCHSKMTENVTSVILQDVV